MADRNRVDNSDIGAQYATYEIDDSTITFDETEEGGSAQVGLAVTFSAADTVQLAGDGEAIVGKLVKVERDGKCSVQIGGVVTLPGGDGATLTLGTPIVGDLGPQSAEGYIRSAASAQAAELLVARGQIQNAATASAVKVLL